MSQLDIAASQFGKQLDAGPIGQAQTTLLTAWAQTWTAIDHDLEQLITTMKDAELAGQPVKPWWVFKQAKYEALQRQAALQVQAYAGNAASIVDQGISQAIDQAAHHATQLGALAFAQAPEGVEASWTRLPIGAQLKLQAAMTGPQSPLKALFKTFPAEAQATIRRELTVGLSLGHGAARIGKRITAALQGNAVRARTIARTEIMRAYRESSRQSYKANAHVLEGWVWLSSHSHRTCPACWAMHGTFHTLDQRLDGHPNCRCTMMPRTKSWEDLGAPKGTPDNRPNPEPGADRFAKLPSATQRKILGPAKHKAYLAGLIDLEDLVARTSSWKWGTMRREASLSAALTSHATGKVAKAKAAQTAKVNAAKAAADVAAQQAAAKKLAEDAQAKAAFIAAHVGDNDALKKLVQSAGGGDAAVAHALKILGHDVDTGMALYKQKGYGTAAKWIGGLVTKEAKAAGMDVPKPAPKLNAAQKAVGAFGTAKPGQEKLAAYQAAKAAVAKHLGLDDDELEGLLADTESHLMEVKLEQLAKQTAPTAAQKAAVADAKAKAAAAHAAALKAEQAAKQAAAKAEFVAGHLGDNEAIKKWTKDQGSGDAAVAKALGILGHDVDAGMELYKAKGYGTASAWIGKLVKAEAKAAGVAPAATKPAPSSTAKTPAPTTAKPTLTLQQKADAGADAAITKYIELPPGKTKADAWPDAVAAIAVAKGKTTAQIEEATNKWISAQLDKGTSATGLKGKSLLYVMGATPVTPKPAANPHGPASSKKAQAAVAKSIKDAQAAIDTLAKFPGFKPQHIVDDAINKVAAATGQSPADIKHQYKLGANQPAALQAWLDPIKASHAAQKAASKPVSPPVGAGVSKAVQTPKGPATALQAHPGPAPTWAQLKADPTEAIGIGVKPKTVYRGPDGKLYLFKKLTEHEAHAEEAAARLQGTAGLAASRVWATKGPKGEWGALVELHGTNATRRAAFGKGTGFDPAKLNASDTLALQKHAVLDWLIGNHDGHADQFVKVSGTGGVVVGVDKGNAFKFFGKDKLDHKYEPIALGGTVANKLYGSYATGKGGDHLQLAHRSPEMQEYIGRLQRISDADYKQLLRPYAEAAARTTGIAPKGSPAYRKDVEAFLTAAVARKNALLADVTKQHQALEAARNKALGIKPPAPPPAGMKGMVGARATDTTWARTAFGAQTKGLTAEQKASGTYYTTSSGAATMNFGLRKKAGVATGRGKDLGPAAKAHIRHIDSAMKPFPEDVIVHRGMGADGLIDEATRRPISPQQLQGRTFIDDGFSSASVGTSAAFGGEIKLRIRANAGSAQGFYLKPISRYSSENEVLLARGTRYYVHSVTKQGYQWVVDAEIIEHNPIDL